MSAAASFPFDPSEFARLGVLQGTERLLPARAVLPVGWSELEQALPDRGFPRGVVEIAARPWLSSSSKRSWRTNGAEWISGGATTIAIATASAVHAANDRAWCAWITPRAVREPHVPVLRNTPRGGVEPEHVPALHAPALVQAGIDLARLLVVRPPPEALARTAVKVAMSGAFELVIVDAPQRYDLSGSMPGSRDRKVDGGTVVVRKLALAAEEYGTTSLLLTNALTPRAVPLPVALRLEVERRPEALSIRVTKDRRGVASASSQHTLRLASAS